MDAPLAPTPAPPWRTCIELPADPGRPPVVSVVLSLYNYGHCILDTLASVASQTLAAIELVVVDDASTDAGAERVRSWLEEQRQS